MIGALIAMAAAATQPIVIAHRGASGERPEHTIAAYTRAIEVGADFIEPDLVMTKDGILIARHENEISGTTDIADHPEFANRKTTKTIDGQSVTGWFTEDFTLAELKTLWARERLPQLRPANLAWNRERIATLGEILALVKAAKRRVGLYPETKHPSYFASIGLPLERPLVRALARAGYTRATDPVFIQSFESGNLKTLHTITRLRLVQLIDADGAAMVTRAGLSAIAGYAQGIGPNKALVINGTTPTALIRDAHAAGLLVHPWTFRAENMFLPPQFQRGDDPKAHGDLRGEIRAVLAAGVDGVFSDFPGEAVAARRAP